MTLLMTLPRRMAVDPQFKVFRSIVIFHSVLVVNHFPLVEITPKHLFHYQAVFAHISLVNSLAYNAWVFWHIYVDVAASFMPTTMPMVVQFTHSPWFQLQRITDATGT